MLSVAWRRTDKQDQSSFKLLLWTAIAGLLFGLIGLGELPEDILRATRNSLHMHKASGDIILVKFDDKSLREVGRWPWPRRTYAEMIDRLTAEGANRIFVDVVMDSRTNPSDDAVLEKALANSGKVTLAALTTSGPDAAGRAQEDLFPIDRFAKVAELGSIGVRYNWQNAIWRIPYRSQIDGKNIPSFAAKIANKPGGSGYFMPDYSIDPRTIPNVSAVDLLYGRAKSETFSGKDVIIGVATNAIDDEYFVPGTGRMGGVYVHIIGAETLKQGVPAHLGWFPLFVLALGLAVFATRQREFHKQLLIIGSSTLIVLFGPALAEARQVYLDVTPGCFVLLTVGIVLARRGFRQRGLVNAVSGLPNLTALSANRGGRDQTLIAARVMNYAEIAATLPQDSERQLVEQIVARLKIGAPDRRLYQGDGGIFAWFEDSRNPVGNHVEALHALFRNPAKVAGLSVDLTVSFGVEIGSSRSLSNRLASALLAAEEAAHDGLKWKYHDPDSLQDASWKLSMLSQLDEAVDKGEVWVAYQPKLDLASRTIVGAEALARWTHPQKGPIAASEFIAAAEQHDRIGKLSDFVLEHAIAAAASLSAKQPDFGMAVNLSARLLDDRGFILRLSAMLARHKLPPHQLTLELTETAALAGSGTAVEILAALRDLGVTISIDDYGTGLSTLDYLNKIPASEIKIDQSFVKGMIDNRSDRVMVQSTIGLAHSLGRKVVAEGVERREILDALTEMKCDVAQGFIIGRPMSFEAIAKRIPALRKQKSA